MKPCSLQNATGSEVFIISLQMGGRMGRERERERGGGRGEKTRRNRTREMRCGRGLSAADPSRGLSRARPTGGEALGYRWSAATAM